MQKLKALLSKLLSDTRGNTVMILALCILPVGIFAGAAIDFSRAESNGNDLRANLDSAAIAAARYAMDNPDAKQEDVKAFAKSYITKSFEPNEEKTLDNLIIEFVPDERVTISADSTIKSSMLSLAQIDSLTSKMRSTASMGTPTGLRAVLVLDNSDSMEGAKLDALEDAATDFVDQLVEQDGNSYVGVVPFNHHITVDTSLKGQSWLDVPIANPRSVSTCTIDRDASAALGCSQVETSCDARGGDISASTTCLTWSCPSGVSTVRDCTTETKNREWCGALIQRPPPHHLLDSQYVTNQVEAYLSWEGNHQECSAPIQPMTNNKSALISYLDDLDAKGDTYIAPGLMWGYRVLSPEAPFTEMSGHTVSKSAIILMSDGANSRSFQDWGTGADHYGKDKAEANEVTLETCDYIKSQEVEIYAIAFQVEDGATEDMLKNCATTFEHFYDADSFTELSAAFNAVAGAFREIALTE